MKKRFLTLFITLFLIIIGLFFTGLFFVYVNFQSVTDSNNVFSYNLEVPSGTSIKTVAMELKKANIIKSEIVFYGYARFQKIAIKAGSYKILSDMNVSQIFQLLQSGVQSHIIVTIPEGLTISKIAQLLEEKNVIDSVSFLEISKNKELLEFYNIPNNSFEGFIFPDTYYFTPNMMAKKVLTMMVDNFFDKIKKINEIQDISADKLYDIVCLASIVEREYRVASEAPLIASVFSNRLKYNMGLYSCATIEYIITEIQGKPHPDIITYDDLQIDNPYNTYKWAGLPPGPISNPGLVALKAAANPPKTDFYYFRLIDPVSGTHHFSKGFNEHNDVGNLYTKKK